jgi:hypothetical protein
MGLERGTQYFSIPGLALYPAEVKRKRRIYSIGNSEETSQREISKVFRKKAWEAVLLRLKTQKRLSAGYGELLAQINYKGLIPAINRGMTASQTRTLLHLRVPVSEWDEAKNVPAEWLEKVYS